MFTKLSRNLRSNMTDAERVLWSKLRHRQILGYKFRRQQPLGAFIVDFVCLARRLVIEVDGAQHAECEEYDVQRTRWLEQQGFRVLRFWNHQVLTEMEEVLQRIQEALAPPPQPSPARGEGAEGSKPGT